MAASQRRDTVYVSAMNMHSTLEHTARASRAFASAMVGITQFEFGGEESAPRTRARVARMHCGLTRPRLAAATEGKGDVLRGARLRQCRRCATRRAAATADALCFCTS